MKTKKLGLIAGMGDLPKAIASEARAQGYSVVGIGLEPVADPSLGKYVDEFRSVNVGKLGLMIETLKRHDIHDAVMAGKVSKALLYKSRITPDLRAMKLLFSLKDRSDDSIMLALTQELQHEGIHLLDITPFAERILAPDGVWTKNGPSREEWKDISFGWRMAKEIGRLDIGQTVVVKGQAVMAVEAIEGTDEAITRGSHLAGKDAVVVKVSKPDQDMRFDVPTVGMKTLHTMIGAKARVLCIESRKCIILEKDRMIAEADGAGISLLGYSG